MTITKIIDKFNPEKIWIIKHYRCGHYYINQTICNKKFYKGFVKTTKKHINEIFS